MQSHSKNSERMLQTLIGAPKACLTPQELADRSQLEIDVVNDTLVDLDVEGWISPWELDGQLTVTLSAWGAEQLKVQLVESSASGTLRWANLGEPLPPPPRSRMARGGDADILLLDTIADKAPPPDILLELNEESTENIDAITDGPRVRIDPSQLPRPLFFLGLGVTSWIKLSPEEARSSCPVCRSRQLGRREYCLHCDRWGLDEVAFGDSKEDAPCRRARTRASRRSTPNQCQKERERRKARRRRKHQAKWNQSQPRPDSVSKAEFKPANG
jgi:hypothetical protein